MTHYYQSQYLPLAKRYGIKDAIIKHLESRYNEWTLSSTEIPTVQFVTLRILGSSNFQEARIISEITEKPVRMDYVHRVFGDFYHLIPRELFGSKYTRNPKCQPIAWVWAGLPGDDLKPKSKTSTRQSPASLLGPHIHAIILFHPWYALSRGTVKNIIFRRMRRNLLSSDVQYIEEVEEFGDVVGYSNKLMYHNIANFEPTDCFDMWPRISDPSRSDKQPKKRPFSPRKKGFRPSISHIVLSDGSETDADYLRREFQQRTDSANYSLN